jgi:glutathione synthase/RimK-type ligase-like ATP-grasp enzyme
MWHFHQGSPKDVLMARQLLFSLEQSGKVTFPDFKTMWHFDDKLGQKYLMESIDAPLVPSHVFFDKIKAIKWANQTVYPKVFKLRGGAGSSNVRLVKSNLEARILIRKAFGKGFSNYAPWNNLKERIRKYRLGLTNLWDVTKGLIRLVKPPPFAIVNGIERGYVYFQDFIPDNQSDIRIIVVDNKAFALRRLVREGDFRASGSGFIEYEKHHFNEETLRVSFQMAKQLQTQCVAFDYIYENSKALVVEISFGFSTGAYDACEGYWDDQLNWYEGSFNPYGWMVEATMTRIGTETSHV